MLRMVDVEFIKLRARDGWSIRETARRTGWSRQAIRKALAAPAAPPRYERSSPRPAPVMDPYLPFVRQWLAGDESAPRKQRHTARRIYDRLASEHGFPAPRSPCARRSRSCAANASRPTCHSRRLGAASPRPTSAAPW